MSPRHADEMSRFFVEIPPGPESGAKCVRVQCVFCNEIKAKNTTRQKAHLQQCKPYLIAHPEAAIDADADGDDADGDGPTGLSMAADQYNASLLSGPGGTTNVSFAPNPRINGTAPGPSAAMGSAGEPPRKKQKAAKQPKKTAAALVDPSDIPLPQIHAAYEEFPAKPGDKCATVRCRYCGTQRAKNTSRQRDHLRACGRYQQANPTTVAQGTVNNAGTGGMNNLSVQSLPAPSIEFDFKLFAQLSPPLSSTTGSFESQMWSDASNGQWSARIGGGTVVSGRFVSSGQVGSPSTVVEAEFVLRTTDQPPVNILCKIRGNMNNDALRATMTFQTANHHYHSLNTGVWVASGVYRANEVVYEAYRVG